MAAIDLSKAKIGDKFKTRDGHIMVYTSRDRYILGSRGEYVLTTEEEYPIHNEDGDEWTKFSLYYFRDGTGNDGLPLTANNVVQSLQEKIPIHVPYGYELVEQVFDDDKMEREIKSQKEMQEAFGIEDEAELQRRKEVLKYADMLFFNQKDTRVALFGYDVAIETAEIIVKDRDEYLKEGKLC